MTPTNPAARTATATASSSRRSEMHNDDVAHEHSDINVRAIVVVDGRRARHRRRSRPSLMYRALFYVLEHAGRGQRPEAVAARDAGDGHAADDGASPFFGSAPEPQLMTVEPST